jgi:TetR/AcrR family transcriptional repressor of bet genes
MSPRAQRSTRIKGKVRARQVPGRQRQRLIDACISALHLYGPSRTTVEKVVALAKMSPGIVRFYFDSKAAMLVASLQFLAAEFEERLLTPVAAMKSRPVAALELLVDLYLDPDIASPRKVSVWYAFWGEASSRQEYYDICGQKDESFAALVRELIERMIAETGQPHLDPDGIALGLIGVLEILWQDFAFRTERDIDRVRAKRRCLAYLGSIFPASFRPAGAAAPAPSAGSGRVRFAPRAYGDERIHGLERDLLFQPAWTVVGHVSQIPHPGDFFTLDTGAERALVVRDADGSVHALRNSCPVSPHALVARPGGRFAGAIECRLHRLAFSLGGRDAAAVRRSGRRAPADLKVLNLASVGGLLFVRARGPEPGTGADAGQGARRDPRAWFDADPPPALMALGPPLEISVAADWKAVVEQWLETAANPGFCPAEDSMVWHAAPVDDSEWSGRSYLKLVECAAPASWRRQFIGPNQLFEIRPDGWSALQAVPESPGRCRVRRMDYSVMPPDAAARAVLYLVRRLSPYARRSTLDVAESVQKGLIDFGYEIASGASAAADWFRRRLATVIPALEA